MRWGLGAWEILASSWLRWIWLQVRLTVLRSDLLGMWLLILSAHVAFDQIDRRCVKIGPLAPGVGVAFLSSRRRGCLPILLCSRSLPLDFLWRPIPTSC